jgi:hypothetical protein
MNFLLKSSTEDEFVTTTEMSYHSGIPIELTSNLPFEFWDKENFLGEFPTRSKHTACQIDDKTVVLFGGESETKENNSKQK